VFPVADISRKRMAGVPRVAGDDWYCDQEEILGVTPKSGDGILFWDYKPLDPADKTKPEEGQATPVPGSQHSGCPVKKGEKWIATRWIRSSTFT
jgi:prolyl 4-hydroxylase